MQADLSTRLRLVEVQTPGGALPLGGGFACVLASPSARSAAARWIATTVVGPRPSGADGTIEIAGRFVSARSLPSPLLPPSAPSVLGQEALRAQCFLTEHRGGAGRQQRRGQAAGRHEAARDLDRAVGSGRPGTHDRGRDPARRRAPRGRRCQHAGEATAERERSPWRLDLDKPQSRR